MKLGGLAHKILLLWPKGGSSISYDGFGEDVWTPPFNYDSFQNSPLNFIKFDEIFDKINKINQIKKDPS